MKIISIDVGIKNLAFCFLEKRENENDFHIVKWDVVNISEKKSLFCEFIEKESATNNKGKKNKVKKTVENTSSETKCKQPAKFTKNGQCFCLKHSKKTNFLIPTSDLKSSFVNKQKIQTLFEMADKYQISYTKPIKKDELLSLINEYIHNVCLEPIVSTNASKIDIITIGKNIQTHFDGLFYSGEESVIDHVIIENQISPIANRMKTIQGMIAQYFIMKNNVKNIEFISAMNKLKDLSPLVGGEKKKMDYSDRKKAGIEKCLELLEKNHLFHPFIQHFQAHKKKDDLADSFLQGIWFVGGGLSASLTPYEPHCSSGV